MDRHLLTHQKDVVRDIRGLVTMMGDSHMREKLNSVFKKGKPGWLNVMVDIDDLNREEQREWEHMRMWVRKTIAIDK